MTVRQVVEYLDAWVEAHENRFREQARLLDGQAQQIASAVACMLEKKAKYLRLEQLYPELFGKKATMPPEQETVLRWRQFLGV